MIEIKVTGCTPNKLIKIVETTNANVQRGMQQMANDTQDRMRDIISQNKKRGGSTSRLENSITVVPIPNGFGVGDMDFMDQVAPHWHIINYGGMVSPEARLVPGFFGANNQPDPAMRGTGVGTDSFNYARNTYMMHVTSPIAAVNYIEKTKDWIQSVIGAQFQGWVRSFSVITPP